MTTEDEVTALFNRASAVANKLLPQSGVMPLDGPDPRWAIVNANFAAMQDALLLIARRIDAQQ